MINFRPSHEFGLQSVGASLSEVRGHGIRRRRRRRRRRILRKSWILVGIDIRYVFYCFGG